MKAESVFLKMVFVILSLLILDVSGANAGLGVKFWAMDVGNYWVWNGTGSLSGVWTWREDVVNIDTTTVPGQTTYYVEGHDVPGSVIDKTWYTFTSTEKRLWRRDFYGDDAVWHSVIIPNGYREGDATVPIGGYWEDTGTLYFDGSPASFTVHNDLLSYENVTTPLGIYKAYKIHHVINIPDLGGVVEDATIWFVPYIGVVRDRVDNIDGNPSDYEIEELASMKINKPIFDRDGDARTDVAVYRSSTGAWYIKPSLGGSPYGVGWGGDANDKPVPGDYDGDGKTDIAVYRASTGAWYVKPSSGAAAYGVGWGGDANDKPVPGDYDGDGKTDIAVYRASTGAWYVYPSGGGAPYGVGWGGDSTDVPVTLNVPID